MGNFTSGPLSARWRGGMTVNGSGYLRFTAKPYRGKYAHRVYMEKLLGRPLRANEEVHHQCGNRACWPPSDGHLILMDAALHDASAATAKKRRRRRGD